MEIFKCQQFRVNYTPNRNYENNTSIWDIRCGLVNLQSIEDKVVIWVLRENEWANLARTEKLTDPETGETLEDEEIIEDTPLLINLKVSNLRMNWWTQLKKEKESTFWVKSILILQGCGYPPSVDCDVFTDTYNNISDVCLHMYMYIDCSWNQFYKLQMEVTFPCYYSTRNPWIVIARYNR